MDRANALVRLNVKDDMMNKLSIVVPCYNEESCIQKFAGAIFALPIQNPYEIICFCASLFFGCVVFW